MALSSLIHALDELAMVAVVRYVYDRRANPQVGMAFPYIKDAYEVKPTVLICSFFSISSFIPNSASQLITCLGMTWGSDSVGLRLCLSHKFQARLMQLGVGL